MAKVKGGKGSKKHHREKKKRIRRGSLISQYVRNLISFDQYARGSNLKATK